MLRKLLVLTLLFFSWGGAAAQSAAQAQSEMRGDVNRDGQINALDALSVLTSMVGKALPAGHRAFPNGDADANGELTAFDAVLILGYIVKKDVGPHSLGRPLVQLSVSPDSLALNVGQTRELRPVVQGSSAGVLWRSMSPGVATVDANGVVKGSGEGSATILAVAQADTTIRAAVSVKVSPARVASVAISPATHTLTALGARFQLAATAKDESGQPVNVQTVTWASSNPAVAKVDAAGVVTAAGPGAVSITAAARGQVGSAQITVAQTAASLAISPGAPTLYAIGESLQLSASAKDANGNPIPECAVTWASLSPSVATVSASGVVTSKAVGEAQISAACGNASTTVRLAVTQIVASVAVAPSAVSVTVGATAPLNASAADAKGVAIGGSTFSWTSSNPSIATVDASGAVKGVAVGSATVTATSGEKSASASVTVENAPVASISLSPGTLSLQVGQTGTLTATLKDANGNTLTGRSVNWSSSNAGVVSVSSSGAVSAVGAGPATITAASEGKSATASVQVEAAPIASVSLSPSAHTLTALGAGTQLSATVVDANGKTVSGAQVSWSSSNAGVVEVSSSGYATAKTNGTATITASAGGKSGTAQIEVKQAVSTLELSSATPSLTVGGSAQLTASAKDANGNLVSGATYSWSSSNAAVATVDASGAVRGVAVGTATITAASGGKSATAAVAVEAAPVASVSLSPSAHTLTALGAGTQLSATVVDANGKTVSGAQVSWSSSNAGVVEVSSSGYATAKANGTATITASAGGKSGTAQLEVKQAVSTLELSPNAPTLNAIGESVQLSAVAKDANGQTVSGCATSWSSLSPGIATVDAMGSVISKAVGVALITVACSGVTDTTSVTVRQLVASVSVTPSTSALNPGQSSTLSATALDSKGVQVTGATFSWTSSNTGVATVDATGVVKGVAAGSAIITVASGGKAATASVAVVSETGEFSPPDLANHNFNDGTFGPYWDPWGNRSFVVDDPTGAGRGKVVQQRHAPSGGESNIGVAYTRHLGPGDHVYFRGRVYVGSSGAETDTIAIQRKLLYFQPTKNVSGTWFAYVMTLWGANGLNAGAGNATSATGPDANMGNVFPGLRQWVTVEVYLRMNSKPGDTTVRDGGTAVWINGKEVQRHDTGLYVLHHPDDRLGLLMFGYQVNWSGGKIDEYRYWDDVAFSTKRIGP
jgi:uncharacterized protein YjdB